jgi:hypothetical protein
LLPVRSANLAAIIAAALDACELFVVLGTKDYGMPGHSRFSTREELEFAVSHNKPIFLVKRCDEFADPLTQMYLPASMYYQEWPPGVPAVPEGLVADIEAKLEAVAVIDARQMWVSHPFERPLAHELITSLRFLVRAQFAGWKASETARLPAATS